MADEFDKLPEIMQPHDVAQYLRVNERTVRSWIESKELVAFPVGKRGYRISRDDLHTFIENRKRRLQNGEAVT